MIIDAHTHGLHGGYLDELEKAGGGWAKKMLAELSAIAKKKPLFDATLRVEMLNRNGIDLQVVTPPNYLDSNFLPGDESAQLALARAINDNMARLMEASKGRLLSVGNIPLKGFERGGLQEMERAMKVLGLKAINLSTNVKGKPLDLPEFESFWAHTARMNVPIYIHPADPVNHVDRSYEKDYDLMHNFGWPFETVLMLSRLVFSGIMARYPTLKIVSHHLGGGIPFFWGRINETYAVDNLGTYQKRRNVSQSLCKPLFEYFASFYYDTAVGGNGPAIRCAHEVFGPDQIVFATDAPWGPGTGETRLADYPKVIKGLGFNEGDNKKIFESNIRKVLNLP
jgi:aminocarboxymuconate-semialdehyde decarboxylase